MTTVICACSRDKPGQDAVSVRSGRALQLLAALAVIAAALLDPFQAAIGVAGFVGVVLIDAGVHAGPARGLLGIFWIHRIGEERGAGRRWSRSGSWRGDRLCLGRLRC